MDVGAHHPMRFSNTYLFYKRGWRGVNLDAMPGSMDAFRRARPLDQNLELGVAETECTLTYHSFSEPALNTFSSSLAEEYLQNPAVRRLATLNIQCRPLASILVSEVPPSTRIDFMSIDVEGLDLQVLRSNDWSTFRPRVVLVEALETDLMRLGESPTVSYMVAQGYTPVAKTVNTVFFRDGSCPV